MLFCILRATLYRGFFLVCCMLWVMLASFFFRLVCLHLVNLFCYLLLGVLNRLQHLDEKVGIIGENYLFLLWSSPRFINPFRPIGMVLVERFCSWLCLWGHNTHVLRRFRSRGHNLRGLYLPSLSFSQLPSGVANLNVVGLFGILGWTAPAVLWPNNSR